MNNDISDSIKKAKEQLKEKDCFIQGDEWYGIQILIPKDEWRKKRIGFQSYSIFAYDNCGNEYLTDKNNSVFFWDHETDKAIQICQSIINFLESLERAPDVELESDQVISVWVNPDFKPEFD